MERQICVVAAATGYGKTQAALHFWDQFSGRKAWWSASGPKDIDKLLAAAAWAWQSDASCTRPPDSPPAEVLPPVSLLVIDLADVAEATAIWTAISSLIEQMPLSARLLLLSRQLPPQSWMHWHMKGRLHLVDHSVLALNAEEWNAADLGTTGLHEEGVGWWGPAGWLALGQGAWTTSRAAWVADVWFPTLTMAQRTLLGQLSLLPDNMVDAFAALHGHDVTELDSRLREFSTLCGALSYADGRAGIAPHFRLAVASTWRQTDPPAWTRALMSTLESEISRYHLHGAAQLADEAGPGAARQVVLQCGGLHMLYGRERSMLGRWLKTALDPQQQELNVLRCAWLVEVDKTAHLADSELRIPLPDSIQHAQVLALQATIALDYDECGNAERLASAALAAFEDDRQPLSMRTRLTRGSALAIQGRLDEAAEDYRIAHLCADREGLIWLQLDSLLRRALLASEQGRRKQAQNWLQQALLLASEEELQNSSAGDSCRRHQAWLHLEMLDVPAARQMRASARPFWAFPHHVHLALEALLEDRLADARSAAAWLTRTLESSFQPRKWQNQAAWIGIWLAAHENDAQGLLYWERHLASQDWPLDVNADRCSVLLAGVRCLLGQLHDPAPLAALLARLQRQGAGALALQLRLIICLQSGHHADPEFYACVEAGAHHQAYLDYLWLGPKVAPLLHQVQSSAQSATNPEMHTFVRHVLQRLQAPVPVHPSRPPSPVAGLTNKETQILRLIGQHYSNEQIAAGLFISMATVKTHINRIYSKLGLNKRSEAIRLARQLFL